MMAPELLRLAGPLSRLIADKAYDTNKLRQLLAEHAIDAVIPSIARRKPLIPYDPEVYRQRNLIERMSGRLKDFRRIATRYDKLARNFLAGVALAGPGRLWQYYRRSEGHVGRLRSELAGHGASDELGMAIVGKPFAVAAVVKPVYSVAVPLPGIGKP